jgi:hypothetical protein
MQKMLEEQTMNFLARVCEEAIKSGTTLIFRYNRLLLAEECKNKSIYMKMSKGIHKGHFVLSLSQRFRYSDSKFYFRGGKWRTSN